MDESRAGIAMNQIETAFRQVREQIDEAARRAGRLPEQVTLVAVTKTRSVDEIREVVAAGATDLGENYVQEMVAKHEALADLPGLRWHAIGHLQRNKIRQIAGFCSLIHSVDSTRLADEIQARAEGAGRRQPVLLEVNIAGEDTKFGLAPGDVEAVAQHVTSLNHLDLRGLMGMTPYAADPEESRRHFQALRELSEKLAANLPPGSMTELSMGMTQDFQIAVEQGATLVRVGTAIFGKRREA